MRLLRREHAADSGAPLVAYRLVARAHALDEDDVRRNLPADLDLPLCRARRGAEPLHLETRDDVVVDPVPELRFDVGIELVEAGRNDYGPNRKLDDLVLHRVVDGVQGADLLAHAALPVLEEVGAVLAVDDRLARHGLRERRVDGLPLAEPRVELGADLHRALRDAVAAAGAEVPVDARRPLPDRDREVANVTGNVLDLRIDHEIDVRVPSHVDHFRRQDARRAVQRRERLVELRHAPADRRLLLDQMHFVSGLRDIERRLDPRDPSADDQRLRRYLDLPLRETLEVGRPRHGRTHQVDGLLGPLLLVIVNPRAVLTYVRHVEHVGIDADGSHRGAECRFVHSRRARRDDDARETVLLDVRADETLPRVGAHVAVGLGDCDAGERRGSLGHLLDIDGV